MPYRIEIEDGPVLRCWHPHDAPLLKDAIDSSLEHLREWMPGAPDEPQELEEKAALLRETGTGDAPRRKTTLRIAPTSRSPRTR